MRMHARKTARSKKPAFAAYVNRVKRAARGMSTAARGMSTRTIWTAVAAVLGAALVIGAATSKTPEDTSAAKSVTTAAAATVAAASSHAGDSVATTGEKTPVTTLTGCLAREDTAYKLKDTVGDEAPKARSWKTGFLKKGSASIEIYDTSNRLKLPAHVGERVTVTGELVDREMYVKSLQRVSTSCATKS